MKGQRAVIVEHNVREAFRRGRKYLEVEESDIVTDLAREAAEQLKIKFLNAPIERPVAVKTQGTKALRRVLFRNNPRWMTPAPAVTIRPKPVTKLALVGAGGVGANLAQLAFEQQAAAEITLVDILPGVAEAIALDLQHAGGIVRSSVKTTGSTSMDAIADAQIIVVTAGRPRTPGMNRSDLSKVNGRLIRSIGESIASLASKSVVIVVTNPVEEMTQMMLNATGFSRERVIGMAGTLDSARFRAALAKSAGLPAADVEAMTLGSHGDEMVPIASKALIRGRPVSNYLSAQAIEKCREDTILAGAAIVNLRKTGSATVAPAHAVLEIVDYMRGKLAGDVPVSVRLMGEYGINETVLGVPCRLGMSGVLEVSEISLTNEEQSDLLTAAQKIQSRMGDGPA